MKAKLSVWHVRSMTPLGGPVWVNNSCKFPESVIVTWATHGIKGLKHFWCWRRNVPDLGANTMPADWLTLKVTSASAGMVLALWNSQHVLYCQSWVHLLGSSQIQYIIIMLIYLRYSLKQFSMLSFNIKVCGTHCCTPMCGLWALMHLVKTNHMEIV